MREFTKEELQEIKRCLKYMIKGGVTPYSCLTIELNKKVQSMIDNYHKGKIMGDEVDDEWDGDCDA